MSGPVLDHKIEQAHEAMRTLPIGDCYAFDYKDETWHFIKVDMWDGEPVFDLEVEVRGDWHEQF